MDCGYRLVLSKEKLDPRNLKNTNVICCELPMIPKRCGCLEPRNEVELRIVSLRNVSPSKKRITTKCVLCNKIYSNGHDNMNNRLCNNCGGNIKACHVRGHQRVIDIFGVTEIKAIVIT